MRVKYLILCVFILLNSVAFAGKSITIIGTGDFHGHLIPRPNAASNNLNAKEGGLAHVYTMIDYIRKKHGKENTITLIGGDISQGGAEALYTRGEAILKVVNAFEVDAFAPGNWDFVYGTKRFIEMYGQNNPISNMHALAANLYYDGGPYADKTGRLVLPPYKIMQIAGLKVGILGFTTDRGPKVVGSSVTEGFRMTVGDEEMPFYIKKLREEEKVDLLVVVTELGLANSARQAEKFGGIDAIIAADMHEYTYIPIITKNGTVISDVNQDGAIVIELTLELDDNNKVIDYNHIYHVVTEWVPAHPKIAQLVEEVRKPFVSGPDFKPHTNPFNGTVLTQPIDNIIGYTDKPLYRGNFTHQAMAAAVEGSSHGMLSDAFREVTGSDVGVIRGFRYGTHILAGPIKLEDIYHFMPIGPYIASGIVKGSDIKVQIEHSADGSLNPDPEKWKGGWVFGFSGVRIELDPLEEAGQRARKIEVYNRQTRNWELLDPNKEYTYASYYYRGHGNKIMGIPARNIKIVSDANGNPIDGTQVVIEYLKHLPNHTADTVINRIKLLNPLPASRYGNPEKQPLGRFMIMGMLNQMKAKGD